MSRTDLKLDQAVNKSDTQFKKFYEECQPKVNLKYDYLNPSL